MKAPQRFHKAFVALPEDWVPLTYLQRSILQDVWRMSAEDHSGLFKVSTTANPVEFIVRQLNLSHRNERPPAIRATKKLFELGLLSKCDEGVQVHLTCISPAPDMHLTCISGASEAHVSRTSPALILRAKRQKVLGLASLDQNRLDQKRESERAPTRAFEKPPVGEPPADLPAVELPTESVVSAHAKEYVQRRAGETPKRDYAAAKALIVWCTENQAVHGAKSALELALRVVAGLFESRKAGESRWPLSWAAHDPAEYLPAPEGSKPLPRPIAKREKVTEYEPPYLQRVLA